MIPIRDGDVYCPRCQNPSVAVEFTYAEHFWFCDSCDHKWVWDHDGIDWIWPEGAKTSPGCPFCGTQNISGEYSEDRRGFWSCLREMCGKTWRVFWTLYPDGRKRWTIRIAARYVPFRRTLDNPTTYPHQETS